MEPKFLMVTNQVAFSGGGEAWWYDRQDGMRIMIHEPTSGPGKQKFLEDGWWLVTVSEEDGVRDRRTWGRWCRTGGEARGFAGAAALARFPVSCLGEALDFTGHWPPHPDVPLPSRLTPRGASV